MTEAGGATADLQWVAQPRSGPLFSAANTPFVDRLPPVHDNAQSLQAGPDTAARAALLGRDPDTAFFRQELVFVNTDHVARFELCAERVTGELARVFGLSIFPQERCGIRVDGKKYPADEKAAVLLRIGN